MPIDMLKHPNVKVGLGDGGAHLGVFQEASCPTFMLTHYVRDRHGERIPLEEATTTGVIPMSNGASIDRAPGNRLATHPGPIGGILMRGAWPLILIAWAPRSQTRESNRAAGH